MDETKFQKIKNHILENKYRYGCVILGGAVVILLRRPTATTIINTVSPVFNNSNSMLGGHLRKIVYCIELDKYFPSVTEAAEFAKTSITTMSRHLNGHNEHVHDLHYKIVGVAN
jgi:hypothetical protein